MRISCLQCFFIHILFGVVTSKYLLCFSIPSNRQLTELYVQRNLKQYDPENFSTEQVQEYVTKAEAFVYELYDQQHLVGFQRDVDRARVDTTGVDNDGKKKSHEEVLQNMKVDNKKKLLYAKLLKAKNIGEVKEGGEVTSAKDQESINRKKNEVKAMISTAVTEYVHYCRTKMDVVSDLSKFGNDLYKDMIKKKQQLDVSRLQEPFCDGHYATKYFNVLKWWEIFGSKRWPSLALAASIVLGKPSHNGFQERVFSRGTYFDDPLKQRLKEESYERSVLNSLNHEKVESLMTMIPQIVLPVLNYEVQRHQIDSFFEKEKQEKDIIGIEVTESVTEKGDDDGDDDDSVSVMEDIAFVNDGTTNKVLFVPEDDDDDALSIMTMMEKEDDLMYGKNEESIEMEE